MTITPRPGHSLTDLEQAADAVIEKLKAEGPTAEEIQKAIAGEELAFVRGLESNLGKAMRLADGAGFHGDPGYFRTEYSKRQAVTADDVKRVANKYLTKGRIVLSIVPMGKLDLAAKPAKARRSPMTPRRHQVGRSGDEVSAGRSIARASRWSHSCWPSTPALAGARSREVPAAWKDAGAAGARLDEDDAGERRRPRRVREARPAAGVVQRSRSSAAPISSSRPSGAGWRASRPR